MLIHCLFDSHSDESIQATLYDTDFLGGDGNPLLGWGNNNQSSLSCSRWPIDDRLLPIIITYNHSCLSRTIGQGRLVVTPNGTNYTYAGMEWGGFVGTEGIPILSIQTSLFSIGFDLRETEHLSLFCLLHCILENLPSYNKWFDPIYEERLPYDVHPYFTPNFSREDITRSFRATIEGADPILLTGNFTHGSLHNYIGGHVIEDTSPNDPLFFLLHGWIDLMWALYQDQWGDWAFYTFPQQYLDSPYFQMGNDLQIFNNSQYTTRDVMDHRNSLGYRYDVQPVDTDIADTVESWWDTWRESPWYELWIALVALLVGLVLGCCVMKCCRSRMIAKRYSEKDEFDQLLT